MGIEITAVQNGRLDRALARGIAWTGAAKWGTQVLTWLCTILVARLLDPEDYGLVAMAWVFLGLIALLNECGLGAAIVALRQLTEEQIAGIHTLACCFGMMAFGLVCVIAGPVGQFFRASEVSSIMVVAAIGFIFVGLRSVPSALYEKELRFKFLAFLEGGQTVLTTLVTIGLAWWGAGYWALVIGGLAGSAAATVVLWVARPVRYARPSIQSLREAIRFSSHVLVSRISWYVAASSDVFIAGRVLGQSVVGAYSFAGTLASVPQDKVTALLSRVMPAFYSTVQHDASAMSRYLLVLTEGLALITFPIAVGMSLVAHDFVLLVLGEKWSAVIVPLQIMAGWAAFRSVFSLVPPLLYVTRASRLAMLNGLLCVATYPFAFWIGSHWGLIGLATAWVLVQPFSWIAPYRHVLRVTQLSLWRYVLALWPALSGVVVMGASVYGIRESMPEEWSLITQLLCQAGGGAITYIAATVLFHRARLKAFVGFVKSNGLQPA